MCLALLALGASAALARANGGRLTMLAGLVVALPPMSIFLFSVVNTNSSETAAGICFAAGLVGLTRSPRSSVAWWAAVVGGVILGLARSLGPYWLAFGLLIFVADLGIFGLRTLPMRRAAIVGATLAAAALACAWWQATRQPQVPMTVRETMHNLPQALSEWAIMLRQTVGVFGWSDTRMPTVVYVVSWFIAIAVGISALIVGSARERVVLTVGSVGLLLASIVISAGVLHVEGFAMQARYMLPPAALLPLYSAEILRRHRVEARQLGRHLLLAVVLIGAAVQMTAWWTNARRYAVGTDGPINFLTHSQWHPILGWAPWLLTVALGAAALIAAAFLALVQDRLPEEAEAEFVDDRLVIALSRDQRRQRTRHRA